MERLITFRNGRKVIPIGQGTWKMGKRRNEEIQALRRGVELGMALIDTAEMYGNEDLVGKAVRSCRDDVFLVSCCIGGDITHLPKLSERWWSCNRRVKSPRGG